MSTKKSPNLTNNRLLPLPSEASPPYDSASSQYIHQVVDCLDSQSFSKVAKHDTLHPIGPLVPGSTPP